MSYFIAGKASANRRENCRMRGWVGVVVQIDRIDQPATHQVRP